MFHERLHLRANPYGLAGRLYSWINFLLSDRSRICGYNGTFFPNQQVANAVIQGSALGPQVFQADDVLSEISRARQTCSLTTSS